MIRGPFIAIMVLIAFLGSTTPLCADPPIELINPGLTVRLDDQDAPDGWNARGPDQHSVEHHHFRESEPSWKFWYNSAIYQSLKGRFTPRRQLRFGGYFYMATDDPLRRGLKCGKITLQFYDAEEGGKLVGEKLARPTLTSDSNKSQWIKSWAFASVPKKTKRIEFVVSCDNGQSGDGSFYVDDLFLEEAK